jgi:GPH family glycoside/pentoside/hexuronide:cation symporter
MSASLSLMRRSNRMASATARCYRTRAKARQSATPTYRSARIRIDPGSIDTLSLRAVSERPPRLSTGTKVLYGLGAVAFGVKDNGFSFFLLLYYNQVLGLPESWVGLGIMLALMADAVFDPVVGYLSDHLHSRWGRRHPFLYASALPAAVAYWFLWNPPAALSHEGLFAYFVLVSVLVRIFVAVNEIPSASLVPELTDQYDERTSILSYRFFFGWWGGLAMTVLAYAVFLQPDAAHPVGVLNPAGYGSYGLVASITMCAAILVSAIGTHAYIPYLKQPPEKRHAGLAGAFRELMETLSNRSFLALFAASIFGAMAGGLIAALAIYINTYFWELTSSQISVLVLGYFVSAVLAVAIAPGLSRRMGKKRAAIATSLAAILIGPLPVELRLLGIFPPNGSPALIPLLFTFGTVTIALLIMSGILTSSMVADIVEDSEVVTGRRSEGIFVAANSFVQKAVSGIGIFASSLLLGAIGFPRGAKPGDVDPVVVHRLGLVYAPTIVVLYLIALAFLATYSISRDVHEANLRKLAKEDDTGRIRFSAP